MDPMNTNSAPAQPPVMATAQPMQGGVRYGGFWVRVLAAVIDGIILGIVTGVIALILRVGQGLQFPIQALLGWLYYAYMESSDKQATLGKQILGLKVTDISGARISFAHATGRHFAKILSAIILCIGFMMVGWTAKKQGLHDIIAKTLVVRK